MMVTKHHKLSPRRPSSQVRSPGSASFGTEHVQERADCDPSRSTHCSRCARPAQQCACKVSRL